MIDPDCKSVSALAGCAKTIPNARGRMNWAVSAGQECPVNVFALTASMLDTEKNLEVTLLYWMRTGGFIFCKKMAGGSLLGLGKDRNVRLARPSEMSAHGTINVIRPTDT
jgi:hypothetical protein